jgi:hypothetical protein
MRLVLALSASLLGASALVTPAGAQALTADALAAQVSAACQISLDACAQALAAAIAAASQLSAQGQASFGAQLAALALANPAWEALIRTALIDSRNPILVASFNATTAGALPPVLIPVASPA